MTTCGEKDILKEGKLCPNIKTFDIPKYTTSEVGDIWNYGGRINSTGDMMVLYRASDNFAFTGIRRDPIEPCPRFNYNLLYFNMALMLIVILYLIKRNV